MEKATAMSLDVLRIGPRILAAPILHGSGDCAWEVRRLMLAHPFDCLAVPLPPSFQADVETAVGELPTISMVMQPESSRYATSWSTANDLADDSDVEEESVVSYVPVDPCQPVIAALRMAIGEHIPRAFIDLETRRYQPHTAVLPDAYALKQIPLPRFAAALLPALGPRPTDQRAARITHMAHRLHELESRYNSILFVCSILDWPWIRDAFLDPSADRPVDDEVEPTTAYAVKTETLLFLLSELPFITSLYERARAELEDDENLSIDGVKELLLSARDHYLRQGQGRGRGITPHLLRVCLKYLRNLTLLERRLTPDLYTMIVAAKQVMGEGFALAVVEQAKRYPYGDRTGRPVVRVSIERAQLPEGDFVQLVSRLPGSPVTWRTCQLQPRPDRRQQHRWRTEWNPHMQCSWPPEDRRIEDFRGTVAERAQSLLGADLARTEKFTTSIQDGIDIRETMRNWHTGELYVRVLPPNRGPLDTVVMLFDAPADPRDYPWRTTWFAEHKEESTLAFYATDYRQELVGPGVARAVYGGAMFVFPPQPLPDIWSDPRFDFATTLEERLLAAACHYSTGRHVALLAPQPPGAGWRRLARHFGKKWVHVPIGQFGASTLRDLRVVHVLNGTPVRSYAARFIRGE